MNNSLKALLATSVLLLAAACSHSPAAAPGALSMAAEPDPAASIDPRVKFKDGERYLRDLSFALDMPRDSICKELSQYDCVNDAFRIILGGVEAENLGVNLPLEEAALTAPIALDRVALQICASRIQLDLDNPTKAVLLKSPAAGRAKKPDKAWMRKTANGLYDAILSRDASASETAYLLEFYDEVAGQGGKANPDAVRDWVTLGCFAVASSLESAFY